MNAINGYVVACSFSDAVGGMSKAVRWQHGMTYHPKPRGRARHLPRQEYHSGRVL